MIVNSFIFEAYGATTFAAAEAKPYVSVVTLLTQDDIKLLQKLKSGLQHTIIWNK